jgi:hypothetical protein
VAQKSTMNLDKVESWRKTVQENIQEFLSDLPPQDRENLNYSIESLDTLENWIITTYPETMTKEEESNTFIHVGVMYYIGEVYRKYLDAYWNVHFAEIEPDYRYGDDPVIEGIFRDMAVWPWGLIKDVLEKRKGSHLSGVLKTYMKLYRQNK